MPAPLLPYKRPFFAVTLTPQEIQVTLLRFCVFGPSKASCPSRAAAPVVLLHQQPAFNGPAAALTLNSQAMPSLLLLVGGPGDHHHAHQAREEARQLPASQGKGAPQGEGQGQGQLRQPSRAAQAACAWHRGLCPLWRVPTSELTAPLGL